MTNSTPAKDYDLQLWSGYSRTRCEQEFDVLATVPIAGHFASYVKNTPKTSASTT